MKTLVGLLALVAVLGVGGVAAYDYTVGGVGLLPNSWTNSGSCCEMGPGCCQSSEATSCCEGTATECAACPVQSASDESPCCAGATKAAACSKCPSQSETAPVTPVQATDK